MRIMPGPGKSETVKGDGVDLREIQRPLKRQYREDGSTARIKLAASAGRQEVPVNCEVRVGDQILPSEAHTGVGGPGTAPCSGDMLLGSLAACAQITCQMVATAMNVPVRDISVTAEGDLDLRGTLAVDRDVPVGFTDIRLRLDIDAPDATTDQLDALYEKTEQYCVVLQTLRNPPRIESIR
jgi:uncharacterized OsmC-like protein